MAQVAVLRPKHRRNHKPTSIIAMNCHLETGFTANDVRTRVSQVIYHCKLHKHGGSVYCNRDISCSVRNQYGVCKASRYNVGSIYAITILQFQTGCGGLRNMNLSLLAYITPRTWPVSILLLISAKKHRYGTPHDRTFLIKIMIRSENKRKRR